MSICCLWSEAPCQSDYSTGACWAIHLKGCCCCCLIEGGPPYSILCSFARTAVTKYHKLGYTPTRNPASHTFRGCQVQEQVVSGVPSEVCEGESSPCLSTSFRCFLANLCHSLPYSCLIPPLTLLSHGVSTMCLCLHVVTYLFYKDTRHFRLGDHPTPVRSYFR